MFKRLKKDWFKNYVHYYLFEIKFTPVLLTLLTIFSDCINQY
jgi:hypothetical protein